MCLITGHISVACIANPSSFNSLLMSPDVHRYSVSATNILFRSNKDRDHEIILHQEADVGVSGASSQSPTGLDHHDPGTLKFLLADSTCETYL